MEKQVRMRLTAATCKALVPRALSLAQARTAICMRRACRLRTPKPTAAARQRQPSRFHPEVGQVNTSTMRAESRHWKERTCKRSTRCRSSPDNKSYTERCMMFAKERYPSVEGSVGPSQAAAPCLVYSRSITHVSVAVKECLSFSCSVHNHQASKIGMCNG